MYDRWLACFFECIDNEWRAFIVLFTAESGPVLTHRRSWIENTNLSMKGSFTDLSNLDLDSVNSTPAMQRVKSVSYNHPSPPFVVFVPCVCN